jgi:hypothetical protein
MLGTVPPVLVGVGPKFGESGLVELVADCGVHSSLL